MSTLTFEEYRDLWELMSEEERQRVKDKCNWEQMGRWAVLNEWPSMRPERLR